MQISSRGPTGGTREVNLRPYGQDCSLHCCSLLPHICTKLLPYLVGNISINDNQGQALWVHNAQPMLRKVCNQYEYKSLFLLVPLVIWKRYPNHHSLEEELIIKHVFNIYGLACGSAWQGDRRVVLEETGLNQHHCQQCPTSRITVSWSYGLMSAQIYWPSLFWRITWNCSWGGNQQQWINGTSGLDGGKISGPFISCSAFSQGKELLAMPRTKWRNFPGNSP